jgi:8-oxo-dGTP pyrophosphatase MutT (NUDIX family)
MRENSGKAKSSFKREFSAGGVVYRKLQVKSEKLKVVWLLGKHSGYHKWVLPKGLIEEGERGFEAALREVKEEMGVRASLVSEKPIYRVHYVYWAEFKQVKSSKIKVKNEISDYRQSDEIVSRRRVAKYQEGGGKKTKVFKVVSFYLMEYESGDPKDHDWEMEDAGWFSFDQAMKQLAFDGEREALRQARVNCSRKRAV